MRLGAALLIGAAVGRPAQAQALAGEEFGLALRDHVVHIDSSWADGSVQTGFGFIVGRNEQGAYIATANHVVRGTLPGEQAETITVTYYRHQGEQFPGTLLSTHDTRRDLAVVRAPMPAGFELRAEVMRSAADAPERGAPVWYVGRTSDWYVPARPGIVNSVDLDERINIEGLNVQVGSSGAPLVGRNGIAGMIIADDPGLTYAVGIDFIERAFRSWAHPWDLTSAITPTWDGPHPDSLPVEPPQDGPVETAVRPGAARAGSTWTGRIELVNARSRSCGFIFTSMDVEATVSGGRIEGVAEGRGMTRVSVPFEAPMTEDGTWQATATGSTSSTDSPWVVLQLSGDLSTGTGTWRDTYNSCGGTMTLSRVK